MRRAILAVLALSVTALSAQTQPARRSSPPRDAVARPAAPETTETKTVASGVIRGHVLAAGFETLTSIAKARVVLSGETRTTDWVFTDASGHFEFVGLPAGRYELSAEKTGYATTRYGARGAADPALPIELAGNATEDVEVRMPKGAAIFGRIVDETGEPVVGARVTAMTLLSAGNARRLEAVPRAPAQTDDLGEYRIGGLQGGRYLLSIVGPEGAQAIVADQRGNRRIGFGRTFYPASPTSAEAIPIELGPGEERGGVDATLTVFRPAVLSVAVAGAPNDALRGATSIADAVRPGVSQEALRSGALITLTFIPAEDASTPVPGGGTIGYTSPARASAPIVSTVSIDPGQWILVARRDRDGAIGHLTVGPAEVASATVLVRPAARFAGRIVFESPTRPPDPASVRLDVIGAGVDAGVSPLVLVPSGPSAPKPDRTFEITGILGTVEFLVAGPTGWGVKSIRVGERELLGAPVTFEGGEAITGVQIVLTDQVGEVAGSLVDADSKPAAGCVVAVFPSSTDGSFNRYRMQVERADKRGQFRVRDLPAGSYLAAAGSDIDTADWTSSASLDRLRQRATAFTLADREKKTMTLSCGSAPAR